MTSPRDINPQLRLVLILWGEGHIFVIYIEKTCFISCILSLTCRSKQESWPTISIMHAEQKVGGYSNNFYINQ